MPEIDKNKQKKIYSTKYVEQLIKDRSEGYDIDWTPFFERDFNLRAPNLVFDMTNEEYDEYIKCSLDPIYFIEHYCKFITDYGESLVELREYQKKIILTATDTEYNELKDLFVPKNRDIIWLAARQCAKTTTLCSILVHKMVFNNSFNCAVMANKESTATELVNKITTTIKGLPFYMKPGCVNFGKTGLKFDNGSQLFSSATTNTAQIGFTIHFMILDEFAHIPTNIVNNFWRSVYPTLSSSEVSQCMIISTPNGTDNKFYEIYSKSISGENTFVNMRTDYWEVPGHDEEWAEKQRANFGEEEFAQEFELQFTKSTKMLMKASDINYFDRICVDYVSKKVKIENSYINNEYFHWHPNFDPNDISPNDRFVLIVDLAEGDGDPSERFQTKERTPDANTVDIFRLRLNSISNLKKYSNISCASKDCVRLEQVGYYSCSSEDEIYAARVCCALAYNLFKDHENNNTRVMVEMNFNGKSFLEEFKRHIYYTSSTIISTYHKKPIPGEVLKKKPGYKTTGNKENYCIKGNKLLSMRRTIVTSRVTFNQMKGFGYVRGKLKGIAMHDDLSMPIFNTIPRLFDESSFISWVEEWIVFYADRSKSYKLNNIIRRWEIENPEMSDSDFMALYGLGGGVQGISYTHGNATGLNGFSGRYDKGGTHGLISPYGQDFNGYLNNGGNLNLSYSQIINNGRLN